MSKKKSKVEFYSVNMTEEDKLLMNEHLIQRITNLMKRDKVSFYKVVSETGLPSNLLSTLRTRRPVKSIDAITAYTLAKYFCTTIEYLVYGINYGTLKVDKNGIPEKQYTVDLDRRNRLNICLGFKKRLGLLMDKEGIEWKDMKCDLGFANDNFYYRLSKNYASIPKLMTLHRIAKYFNTTIDYLLVGDDEGENEKEYHCEVTTDELIAINQKSKDRLKTESIPMDYLSDSIIFEDIIDVNTSDPDKVTISLRVRRNEEIYRSLDPIEKLILNSKKISQKEFFDKLFYTKRKPCIFETDVSEEPEPKDAIDWSEFVEKLKEKNSDLSGIKGKEILEEVSKMFENRCENIIKDPIKGKLRFYNKKKDN